MKKHFSNKLYDTSTATLVGSSSNRLPASDFTWMRESLYRKRTGEYFLYGEGGPMTRYAKRGAGADSGFGEEIIPLTLDAAQKWAESHLEPDEYKKEFSPSDEDEGNTLTSFSFPASIINKIRMEAARRNITFTAVLTELVDKNL